MRRILAGLVLLAIPGAASAECSCTCSNGQPMPVCTQALDVLPICNRICPQVLTQSLSPTVLVSPITTPSLTTAPPMLGVPTDPAGAAAAALPAGAGSSASTALPSLTGGGSGAGAGAAAAAGQAGVSMPTR